MKADASGTFTEQMRARVSWCRDRNADVTCGLCEHRQKKNTPTGGVSFQCGLHNFSTVASATCDHAQKP